MPGNKLTNDAARRIAGALRKIPKPKPTAADNSLQFDPFWVKLTGFATNRYQWKRQYADPANPGQFIDFSPSITGDFAYLPGWNNGSLVGKNAWIQYSFVDGSNNVSYIILAVGGDICMQVDLTQDNGAGHNGDATHAASFTYTPKDLSGNAVKNAAGTTLTAMTPTHNRRIGYTTAAKQGVLIFKPDGSVVLRWTDEVAGTVQRSC